MNQANETPIGFQFGLKFLFVLTLYCAIASSVIATLGMVGIIVLLPILFLVAGILAACRKKHFGVATGVGVGGGLCVLLLMTLVSAMNDSTKMSACHNNLHRIGVAIRNYHSTYGSLPPAYIAGESGNPMHSWRVLILPYLGEQTLYDKYDFGEPWNGLNNRELLDQMPDVFRCPAGSGKPAEETSYVVVVGAGTMWPGETAVTLNDATVDDLKIILVVEVANAGIGWMEPRELHKTQMARTINPTKGQGVSSNHLGIVKVLLANGNVRSLENDLTSEQLEALLNGPW